MKPEDKIIQEIRGRLMRFVNGRERAYREIRKRGLPVPDLHRKENAIAVLRAQLQASASWSLRSHMIWVDRLRSEIKLLLPYEFHDDPRQVVYRKSMMDLLNYCSDNIKRKQTNLFTNLKRLVA